MRVHRASHKIVALHAVLVCRSVREVRERRLAQLMFFQFPEVLEIQSYVKSHGPVIILALDRVCQRLSLRVALDADVVSLNIVQACWIDYVGARRLPDVFATRTMAPFASNIPFRDRLGFYVVVHRMAAVTERA